MNKFKLFIQNFLVYGLGGIISKIIPLIMVPIVTRLMPSSEYYGLNDMANAVISFASALAIMGMYDAMFRLFFDKADAQFKKSVCSTALIFVLATSALMGLLLLLFRDFIAEAFFHDRKYAYLVYLTAIATFTGASNSIISAPTRMQNQKKVFLIANTISPILSYSISIPLLLNGHYIIALPLASVVSGLTTEISFGILNRKWFSLKAFNPKLLKPLLAIAIPLLPNFLIYWVFNSSDKVMITNLMSIAAEGVYSVGAKLGHASQLIYTAFAGGWQYFAFSTMKEKDQVKSNSLVFEYLGIISFACSTFVFALALPIYQLLFEAEYVVGYIVSPYLFLAPLLQMLFQVAANQFLVIKKTWPNILILVSGAIINVGCNLFLIPALGIEGAAIATLVGYAVSDIICMIVLCRMKLMVVSGRFLLCSGLMLVFIVIWRLFFKENVIISLLMALAVCATYCLLYKQDISGMIRGLMVRKSDN